VNWFRKWWRAHVSLLWKRVKPRVPAALLLIAAIGMFSLTLLSRGKPDTASINQLYADVSAHQVQKVEFEGADDQATVELKDGKKYLVAYVPEYGDDIMDRLEKAGVPVTVVGKGFWEKYGLLVVLPILVLTMICIFLYFPDLGRQDVLKHFSKVKPAGVPPERFRDVVGADEVLLELGQAVDCLRNPEKFNKFGVRPLTGYLLYGPPGTGKTLLARAVAGEAGVPFFAVSGSDFNDQYISVGSKKVKQVFTEARKAGPSIVFIDEIDAIGAKRSSRDDSGSKELNNTLNQLLTEIDGFETRHGTIVIVIGATNRPEDLDPALTRPGRLTRQVAMPIPDRSARSRIIKLHASKLLKVADDVDYDRLTILTSGLAGADLAELANQAGLIALREDENATEVAMKHFMEALETARIGPARKSIQMADRDRNVAATHESGHTLVALFMPEAGRPQRVSIIPRGPAGGVTWTTTGDEQFLSLGQLKARLAVALGGRAAEKMVLGENDYTTGAEHDLHDATTLATHMICTWGMGPFTARLSVDGHIDDPRAAIAAEEIDNLIKEAEREATHILNEHRSKVSELIARLLAVETLDAEQLAEMFDAPA